MLTGRSKEFERNMLLEAYLKEINSDLWLAEKELFKKHGKPKLPLIFVVGVPRSGTTLLMQWLAQSNCFSYPSNLISRFFRAPAIGAKIQKLLTDSKLSFGNELEEFHLQDGIEFKSRLGKTKGFLAPNEFWYFWRRFFPDDDFYHLPNDIQGKESYQTMVNELAVFESVLNKPLAFKGMMFNWILDELIAIIPNILFLYIERDPVANMQSILNARLQFFNDKNKWYSFRPPEYFELENLPPEQQVAGQVYYTNRAIQNGLKQLSDDKYLKINYEDFCKNPKRCWHKLHDKLAVNHYKLREEYTGPHQFMSRTYEQQSELAATYQAFPDTHVSESKTTGV